MSDVGAWPHGPASWSLGLDGWIIQDGNYPDLARGGRIEVAVEFGFLDPPRPSSGEPSARLLSDSTYLLNARVLAVEEDAWVLDIGFHVFDQKPPTGVRPGDVLSGKAYLGVDPFYYFERLAKVTSMPPLIYTWDIEAIRLDGTPRQLVDGIWVRDRTREAWEEVEATDAWGHHGGDSAYVLDCRLLDCPPKRVSATAT